MRTRTGIAIGLVGALAFSILSASGQTFRWLGALSSSDLSSAAYDVSNGASVDEVTVVGVSRSRLGGSAVAWRGNQVIRIPTPGGRPAVATGVSADGSLVGGNWESIFPNYTTNAFFWNFGSNTLGSLGTGFNNRLVLDVGSCALVGGPSFIWRCPPDSPIDLTPVLGTFSEIRAISKSPLVAGQTLMGGVQGEAPLYNVFVYRFGASQPRIIATPNSEFYPELHGVSDDNRYAVWSASIPRPQVQAGFVYDFQTNISYDLPGSSYRKIWPLDVSNGAEIVVGYRMDAQNQKRAVLWKRTGSASWDFIDLSQRYASQIGSGSYLEEATAVSSDGRFVVGYGFNAANNRIEAFLLDRALPCSPHRGDVNNDCIVDDADLLAVLFAFGQSGFELGREDANCDRVVDDADLLIVLFNFGADVCEYVYIPDRDQRRGVWRYNIRTNTLTQFGGCAQQFYYGVAKHPTDGSIWISRHTSPGFLDVLDPTGSCIRQIQLPAGSSVPRGLDVFSAGKRVVVAAGQLYCYNNQNNTWSSISLPSGTGFPTGVAWGPSMSYLYVSTSAGFLLKYNHNNGCPTTVAAQGQAPNPSYSADIEVLPDGRVLMAVGSRIVEFDADCNYVRTLYDLGAGNLIHGVAVDSSGTIWATEYNSGRLYRGVGSSLQPVVSVGGKVGEGLIAR